jgi:hypothetical protein
LKRLNAAFEPVKLSKNILNLRILIPKAVLAYFGFQLADFF